MDSDLFAFVYVSKPILPFSDPALVALLDSAREFNRGDGVTGFLVCDPLEGENGTFVQILRGTTARRPRCVRDTRAEGVSPHRHRGQDESPNREARVRGLVDGAWQWSGDISNLAYQEHS